MKYFTKKRLYSFMYMENMILMALLGVKLVHGVHLISIGLACALMLLLTIIVHIAVNHHEDKEKMPLAIFILHMGAQLLSMAGCVFLFALLDKELSLKLIPILLIISGMIAEGIIKWKYLGYNDLFSKEDQEPMTEVD